MCHDKIWLALMKLTINKVIIIFAKSLRTRHFASRPPVCQQTGVAAGARILSLQLLDSCTGPARPWHRCGRLRPRSGVSSCALRRGGKQRGAMQAANHFCAGKTVVTFMRAPRGVSHQHGRGNCVLGETERITGIYLKRLNSGPGLYY